MGRIGLLGGECSGKSTLAQDLGRLLAACVVTERLRDFVDANGRTPEQHEQLDLMLAQQAAEDDLAASCRTGLVVADSAPLMIAVYSVAYFDDPTLIRPAVELARRYDLILWCDVDLPWQADGIQRDGPAFRQREHEIIGDIVHGQLGPIGLRVQLVSGPREVRAEAAGRAWQLLGPDGPT